MRPGKLWGVIFFLVLVSASIAQTGLGTITGIVTDPSGAVVTNASVEAKNTETGVVYRATTTDTGNYTVLQLPVGGYDVTITVQGFKSFSRRGLSLAAAQSMRIDISLELGSSTESVTVSAAASMLKTESSELTHNVTIKQLDNLPILGVNGGGISGNGTAGFRDPFALLQLIPGTTYAASNTLTVNGAPTDTENILIEGQTGNKTGAGSGGLTQQIQPSVDAIQEVAVQTTNFAAEFGTVGGGIFNVTMKSGTNQYHGTLYDYAVNEVLNAAQPYTGLKSTQRRMDYGGTLGGPVKIPKIYNGENKTFFFWNFEQYRENLHVTSTTATVPTAAYRIGDFSQLPIFSGVNGAPVPVKVGTASFVDPIGRTINSGTIFDPTTQFTATCSAAFPTATCVTQGQTGNIYNVKNPFPQNMIPQTTQYLDPVAAKILALVPQPTGPNALAGQIGNNYQKPWTSHRTSQIPSAKIDQQMGAKGHLSFYYAKTVTESQYSTPLGGALGLPDPLDPAIGTFLYAPTVRANYDQTVSSNLLMHLGLGYTGVNFDNNAPVTDFNSLTELGLKGATLPRNFPQITTGSSLATGGLTTLGPFLNTQSTATTEHRPSANWNASWVKGSHSYKIGGEWRYEQYPVNQFSGTNGSYTFGGGTVQPALQGFTTSQGSTGFPFADLLMGNVSAVSLSVPADFRTQKTQIALFVQDSWKIMRKLTLDYGLRWDFGTYAKEEYGRVANFDFNVPNASAGGHPGGNIFEATCNCQFASNYPYAIGPRLGFAYQIDRKTVFRGGWGVVYSPVSVVSGSAVTSATGQNVSFGQYLFQLQNGIPSNVQPQWPVFQSNVGQGVGVVTGAPTALDRNAGRPAKQVQFSAGIQREIGRNLVVEVSYVGNRGTGWPAALSPGPNDLSVASLAQYGFTVGTAADSVLLRALWSNLTPAQLSTLSTRGVSIPYTGFPTSQTVRQSIRAFPQYSTSIETTNAPLGLTWYDSLQTTVTKRLSHGLSLNGNFHLGEDVIPK